MSAIEIDSSDKDNLALNIEANIGKSITFSNGCHVSLIDDNGIYWGECPYGQVWGCDHDPGFIEKIINWLSYWDKPRDETGQICD